MSDAKSRERERALVEVLAILEGARLERAGWYVWIVEHRKRRLEAARRRGA